jgi:outer membrane protein assembly factor BamB
VRRWILIGAGLAVLALVAAAAGYVLVKQRQAEDVHGSSTVEFVTNEQPVVRRPKEPGVLWETYGFDDVRSRVAPYALKPPFRKVWTFRAQALLEFPPAIAFGRLYFAANDGDVFAVSAKTGKRAWKRATGRCQASSPAVAGRLVFVSLMNKRPCNRKHSKALKGKLVAYYAGSGKVRWSKTIGPSESSPAVANGLVYVGDWNGRVWSFVGSTGRLRWVTRVGSKQVKGAVAISGNRLYVGDYGGHLYALDARTGKVLWRGSSQQRLGGRGQFYSTPSAAYGRVYLGSTDGKVYSFGATSGKVRWSHGTGGYVYSSPAVWKQRIYVGSYSGKFLCLDAATGDVKWTFKANGKISGSPTVLDGIVYFATLKRRTYGLDVRTGRQVWAWNDGKYSPVVADAERLYLVGYARLYGMVSR